MRWFFATLLACSVLFCATAASAEDKLNIRRSKYIAPSTLATVSFNSGVWSGWISVGEFNSICWDVYHDYTSATGVTLRCEGAEDKTTDEDAGYDIPVYAIGAAGAVTSSVMTISHLTGADARFSLCVDDLPAAYVNCYFDDIASGAAGDKIAVSYRLLTP